MEQSTISTHEGIKFLATIEALKPFEARIKGEITPGIHVKLSSGHTWNVTCPLPQSVRVKLDGQTINVGYRRPELLQNELQILTRLLFPLSFLYIVRVGLDSKSVHYMIELDSSSAST